MRLWITNLMGKAYFRRDAVAIITVQGKGARLLVYPTNSLHFVLHRLSHIRVGGATPFDKGLILARRVILQWRTRYPGIDLVIVTDGRPTSSLSSASVRGAIDFIRRFSRQIILVNPLRESDDFAQALASALGAKYICIESN